MNIVKVPEAFKGQQLSAMLLLATTQHNGQFDKGGQPYILHCLKVMHYTRSHDEEIQCIALGHDVIEDTYTDVEAGMVALEAKGFSDRIIRGILALTKRPGQSHKDYRIAVASNPDAVIVKMADLRHNTDIRRLKGVTPKDIERMVSYHDFYTYLKGIDGPSI